MIHICIDSILLWAECVCLFKDVQSSSHTPHPSLIFFFRISPSLDLFPFSPLTSRCLTFILLLALPYLLHSPAANCRQKRAHTKQNEQKSDENQYDYRDNQVSCVSMSNQPFRFNIFDKYVPHTQAGNIC